MRSCPGRHAYINEADGGSQFTPDALGLSPIGGNLDMPQRIVVFTLMVRMILDIIPFAAHRTTRRNHHRSFMIKQLHHTAGLVLALLCVLGIGNAYSQEKVLNLYSSRHYDTDEALYTNFTKQTGIKINRIEGGEDPLIERVRNEGDKSPADVLITVDAGRLWRAEQMGLFQPVKSQVLESRIPAAYRHPDGLWYGFSARARIIAYNKAAVKPGDIANYEDLANPKWKGKICTRSAGHVYNLSLMSSLVNSIGEAKTEEWAKSVASNLARTPK